MDIQTPPSLKRWAQVLTFLVITLLAVVAMAAGVLVLLCIINLIGHVVVDISHL